MTHPLDGKTAVVTGAISGIGLAIAEDLAAGGLRRASRNRPVNASSREGHFE